MLFLHYNLYFNFLNYYSLFPSVHEPFCAFDLFRLFGELHCTNCILTMLCLSFNFIIFVLTSPGATLFWSDCLSTFFNISFTTFHSHSLLMFVPHFSFPYNVVNNYSPFLSVRVPFWAFNMFCLFDELHYSIGILPFSFHISIKVNGYPFLFVNLPVIGVSSILNLGVLSGRCLLVFRLFALRFYLALNNGNG